MGKVGDESDGGGGRHQERSPLPQEAGQVVGPVPPVWEGSRGHVILQQPLWAELESTSLGMVFQGERQAGTQAWRTPSLWGRDTI